MEDLSIRKVVVLPEISIVAGPISTFIHETDECSGSAVFVRSDSDLIWNEHHRQRLRLRITRPRVPLAAHQNPAQNRQIAHP